MPSSQPAAGHLAVDPAFLSSQPSPMAKTSEPNRNKLYNPSKTHITDTPLTRKNWYKHVNWLNVFLIVGIPLLGCIQAFWTPLYWQTAVWAVAYYYATGLGITAGKHLLNHRPATPAANNSMKAIIDCGHILPTPQPFLSASFWQLLVVAPSKAPSDGGLVTIVLTIDTPIPTKTRTLSARVSSIPTSDGC